MVTAPTRLHGVSAIRRRVEQVTCPYCRIAWGPWNGELIEPCPRCKRPLFLGPADRAAGLLDAINAAQGCTAFATFLILASGWIEPRTLGQTIAMAMFVSATAHATDGALGLHSGVIRFAGQLRTGHRKAFAMLKIAMGTLALVLSLVGVIAFTSLAR